MHKLFKRLQWKLTLSYTLITSAVLFLSTSAIGLYGFFQLEQNLVYHEEIQRSLSSEIALLKEIHEGATQEQLDIWLEQAWQGGNLTITKTEENNTAIIFPFGRLGLIDASTQILSIKEPVISLSPTQIPNSSLQSELKQNPTQAFSQVFDETYGTIVSIIPIDTELYLLAELPMFTTSFWGWLPEFLRGLWRALLLSLIIGTLFGYLASRGLVKRLKTIGQQAEIWSQGNFQNQVQDTTGDEITDLSYNLNQMALQLEDSLTAKTQLAALEERDRLARELHDTIKQQAFSAQMQLASLDLAQKSNPELVKEITGNLLELNKTMQEDLASIILALRPALLEDIGLVKALKRYTSDWQKQTAIEVSFKSVNLDKLSLDTQFALYRVAGETLKNIEKHARASQTSIQFDISNNTLEMNICDNGIGFNTQEKHNGFGLTSMQERIHKLKGKFKIDSSERGSCIYVSIPITPKEHHA